MLSSQRGEGALSVTALCRDCAAPAAEATGTCPRCGGRRLFAHPELASLTIAHIDCDAFYASIEKRDDPALAARPVIVGGGRRGVVTTACYIARAYGVRSAMPMFKALKLCPEAVVVKPAMAKYVEAGRAVRAILAGLTPLVEPVSIDEAYLDLTGCAPANGGAAGETLARAQARIEAEIGVTTSVGLSFNKLLAKIASDLDKPRGFAAIGRGEALAFLTPRPVSILPGVGPAGARALADVHVRTIGDLRAADPRRLEARFGAWGARLLAFANAEDPRRVDPEGARKSLSAETTFHDDIKDPAALADVLWILAEKVAVRARAADCAGASVVLKLKTAQFRLLSRRRTLSEPTLLASRIYAAAEPMLRAEADGRIAFRLLGVGLADLAPAQSADRGDLLDGATPRRAAADAAVARARARFGATAIETARSLKIRKRKADPDA
jgi:DNA polymerase-4